MSFAPGNIVTLKSGGHPMTVASVDDEDVECLWLGDTGEFFRQSIPAIALTVVEAADIDEMEEEGEEQDDEEEDEDEDEDEEEGEDEADEDEKPRSKRRAR
jgi:uncharacterized protein YodC (DUF2158 family)